MRRIIMLSLIFFVSCKDGNKKNASISPIKSKIMMRELKNYLNRADEITGGEIEIFHIYFSENKQDCLIEFNVSRQLSHNKSLEINEGYYSISEKIIIFHNLNSPCSNDFVDAKLLSHDKINKIEKPYKDDKLDDDLFQYYLVTGKGTMRKLYKI